jgi:hypothetical protein
MNSAIKNRLESVVDSTTDCSLCVLELALLSILFGISLTNIGLFVFFFLTHFYLSGAVLSLVTTKLAVGERRTNNVVIVGVVADCVLLLLSWRSDHIEVYVYYPIFAFVLYLILLKSQSVSVPNLHRGPSVAIRILLTVQVILPILWVLSPLRSTGDEIIHQVFGAQSVSHWPPHNLVVADIPYSNNYMLHLLLSGMRTATNIDLVLLVTRISPIFLSWLFAKSLFDFGNGHLKMPASISLLPGFSFFIVFGYSPVMGHVFGAPTATASLWVQSPLFSFSIMLLIIETQALAPRFLLQKGVILFSICAASFVGTGARAQLGPVIICAQALLMLQAIVEKEANSFIWRGAILASILIAVGGAIIFFLSATSDITGISFLRYENPTHFIIGQMDWFYVCKWLSNLGMAPLLAAGIAFIIIIVMQSSFLLPGFILFLRTSWKRGFAALSPAEAILLGIVIAGVGAVCFTEAPGGSHYVFLQFSKIAMIVLAAIGLSDCVVTSDRGKSNKIIVVFGITIALAVVQVADACIGIYEEGIKNVARAFRPVPLPDAEFVKSLRRFFDERDDRYRSAFIYFDGLSQLGSHVLPVQLGLQTIGDHAILAEYAKWESSVKSVLQQRLCLIKEFDRSVKAGFVAGNLIYAFGGTLLRNYDAIYVIAPPGTRFDLPKEFEERDGPDFSVYRIPMTAIAQQTKRPSATEIGSCQD